jgi:chloramphenicol 3-O-phosphotransferase
MGGVIMLSGPVGAGKSAVARELVTRLAGPAALVEGDAFWCFLPQPASPAERRQHLPVLVHSMTVACVPLARSGFNVLLDFSIPPQFIETARGILKETSLDFVVLRPSIDVCAARAASRVRGAVADYAPYEELYAAFDGLEAHRVDDGDVPVETVAKRVHDGLAAGRFRVD